MKASLILSDRIDALAAWGVDLERQLHNGTLDASVSEACQANHWFTPEGCRHAVTAVCRDLLDEEVLRHWTARYTFPAVADGRRVGIVMAGNLPLVGLADLIAVVVCGCNVWIKPSSKDRVLTLHAIDLLKATDRRLAIELLDSDTPVDMLIATGNDRTADYFARQGSSIATLTRGSRTSIALLTGDESDSQLEALAEDIFLYFGLGCRNVSRLLVPEDYDIEHMMEVLRRHPIHHTGYLNNYRQRRAERLMNSERIVDGGFFLIVDEPDSTLRTVHPLSEIGLMRYGSIDNACELLKRADARIQCVVSSVACHPRRVPFGRAQHPSPGDYADGVDVVDFLLHTPILNRRGQTIHLK